MKDKKTRTLKPLGAFLLALVMVLTHVMGAMDVYAAAVKKPTINPVFYDATTISGANLAKAHVKVDGKKKTVIATVHVTLKGEGGTVKATLSDNPTKGTTWKVDLPEGVKVAKGDKVTVYQQIGEDKSPEVNVTAQASKASSVTLKMPSGEIWIEQTSSNIVNADEQAEAVEMFNNENTAIAGDISTVKFSINTAEHAYYEVTYTDGSTSGKVEAPNLKIKQVTEHSRGATLGSITIVDNVIKGKLSGEKPFTDIKVQIILKLSEADKGKFCSENKCTVDKDSSKAVDATVDGKTGEFTYTIPNPDLKLDQVVGVTVKEPHKFVSCSTTTVKPVIPEKTEVKDPRKLTAKDKKAIDAAIRAAYTVNGESKLPNGTGYYEEVPAVIQIDDSGNVKIFSGNDVAGDWDSEGTFVPKTNADGSYKVKDGAEPKITIPAKDLVKNIAPKSPAIKVDTDKGEVTITPPAYKDLGDDTDLLSYTITYKDNSGAKKTVTATRDLQTNKWSGPGVDENTGVITLSVEKIELAGTIKATAKDNGGLEGDTDKLDSDKATKTLETATVSYDANKGTGEMTGKTVNKGAEYEILSNAFKAPDDTQEFKAWEVDGKEVAAGAKIKVDKDTVIKALWKKSQATVSYDANGGKGTMEGKTVDKGSDYTVLPNAFKAPDDTQEFDTWEVNGEKVAPNTKIKVDKDTVIKALWKKSQATVSYDANGGKGTMEGKTVDKGSDYTVLPNAFKAPDDTQEFDTWEVNGEKVAPNTKIKVDKDTVIKALWKKSQATVSYDANGGKGTMEGKTVDKGSDYTVLPNAFKAPDDTQEFDTWEVDGQKVAPGTEITVEKDTVVKAIWKDKTSEETPTTQEETSEPKVEVGDDNVTITPTDKDTTSVTVEYKDPENKDKKITVTKGEDGKFKGPEGIQVNPDNGEITIPKEQLKPNTTKKDIQARAYKKAKKPGKSSPVPAITWKGYWYLGANPVQVETTKKSPEMEIGRHYKYLYGYVDKAVRPEGMITRSEAAALIARLAELDMTDKTKPNFKDTPSAWYNSAINIMVKKDLMFGDKNGNFRPNEPITRGEFARALYYIDKKNDKVAPFADVKGHEFEAAINQAYGNDRIAGYPDGSFKPNAYIQRAEAARILNQYANRNVNIPGMEGVKKDLIRFTDINENHWAYCEIMEAANSHEYQRVKGSQVETWLRILDIKADWE
ncbi:S-layer homology domain-containing protein [Urinicoccus massiliensis]|uniref:S-layer homology domain-containing protein n=1 Tax=Urinicoccus massiliensis TaxID=1723382 RepID=UPI0009F94D4C|nr:S-layer homology domain-containing protein [Urinicoccus massiliensis]